MEIGKLLESSPSSIIYDGYARLFNRLRMFDSPVCSISGGSDSDIMLHMIAMVDEKKKVRYVFFDTGLEFEATKRHIKELEEKYSVKIETLKAEKPVPYCVKKYGEPFLSKKVSEYMERLQRYGFKWEDEDFETLFRKYPKCKAALRWWCNDFGEGSRFNIDRNKYLKEFIMQNPPNFRISNRCCTYAKKNLGREYIKATEADLNIIGVRKSEGGARATAYKSCFSPATDSGVAEFRPIFWFENDTKRKFEAAYDIKHSDCYEVWGLRRVGCGGCPFNKDFEIELEAVEKYEPKLYKALVNVFGRSYEYTKAYRAYWWKMRGRERNGKNE